MSEIILVDRPEIELLGPSGSLAIARAKNREDWLQIVEVTKTLKITDAASKETAVGYGRLLQTSEKELSKLYTEAKQAIDLIKKPILAMEKEDLGTIKVTKDTLGVLVQTYNRDQEKIHQEALRTAREEALKAAEEQKIAEAIYLESVGEIKEAEQVLNERILAPAVIVQKTVAKVTGEVGKHTYSAQVSSLIELVKAVAAGVVPVQAIKADEPWLNSQARAFRTGLNYPGVVVVEKESLHFRS